MERAIRVTHYHRRPMSRNFSIERVYADIREFMAPPFVCEAAVCRFESRGVFRRLYNIIEAIPRQGDVNHITGDVHYLSFFLHRRRTLLTIHDCASLERLRGVRRYLLWLLWYRIPVRRAALISVGSTWAKHELLRHVDVPGDRIRVVPHPVSPRFVPCPRPNHTEPVLLQVGTGENKNLVRLAEALAGLPCRLHIVGHLSEVQAGALERNRVRYAVSPSLTNDGIAHAYEEADAVAFVSTYEGFGLPVIEANAVGRPVITSAVGPMPEVAGDAACIVDPYDVASIRQGLRRVLTDQVYADTLVARGLDNAARYQPAAVARRYAEIYDELLGGALDRERNVA
jgi:glycosyltransferase involved in cell wall biosynthesis